MTDKVKYHVFGICKLLRPIPKKGEKEKKIKKIKVTRKRKKREK